MSIKESEAYHLFLVFLYSSYSSVSKSQRLELPFIFNKSPACFVLRDFNEYTLLAESLRSFLDTTYLGRSKETLFAGYNEYSCCFFLGVTRQPSKICLS